MTTIEDLAWWHSTLSDPDTAQWGVRAALVETLDYLIAKESETPASE
ncbi:MAG: hypothetical protein Tp182DCM212571_25 [Prokaryotic dsDNA virus sp.]|jgi:hypothetical protein|nr:MAG: hypothetical protein Tp182DCM212571_25 [Prokaryotic dsDNA virus sp.]